MKEQEKLALATKLCDKKNFFFNKIDFNRIYPFTTENIANYIDLFDLKDKSLLTVGSSADQAFNAILNGCKDITIIDKSPFTKEFYYLKKSALMTLEPKRFLQLFSLNNYQESGKTNNKSFNYYDIEEVLDSLLYEDYDSYNFWNNLFKRRDLKTVREKLFITDESPTNTLINSNNYLSNEDSYYKLREEIEEVHPNFLINDVRLVDLQDNYDNIFLSNIFDYIRRRDAMEILNNMLPHLNDEGKILIYYLYSITLCDDIPEIDELYDPNGVIRYVPYSSELIPIPGIEKRNDKQKDGVIIYQKKKET